MENLKKNPLSLQLNVEDFAPASNEEKKSLVIMRESVGFWLTCHMSYGAVPPLTMSCQTSMPMRSQSQYQRSCSILMCLRSRLKPRFLAALMSAASASIEGALRRPSDQ